MGCSQSKPIQSTNEASQSPTASSLPDTAAAAKKINSNAQATKTAPMKAGGSGEFSFGSLKPTLNMRIKKKTAGATAAGANSGSSQLPATRIRADSWNIPGNGSGNSPPNKNSSSPTSSSGAVNGHHHKQHSPNGTAVNTLAPKTTTDQWKMLWEHLSRDLLDPSDVHAVLDALIGTTVNKLSPTELCQIQRRVRAVVKATSTAASAAPTSKMMGRVFSSTAGISPAEQEARAVAEKYHLLNPLIFARIFRPCHISTLSLTNINGNGNGSGMNGSSNGGSNGSSNNSSNSSMNGSSHNELAIQAKNTNTAVTTINLIENAYILMLHLSESLWDRVADIAVHTATAANLEMDVNKQVKLEGHHAWNLEMPRPSVVPDVTEPPVLPAGVTTESLVFLVALALRGTRPQRLQLLFYLLMSPNSLYSFLATHAAGGVPVWLLEVDCEMVVSLASLTHYHYYGNAFLPRRQADGQHQQEPQQQTFVASKSRKPVTIQSAAVLVAVDTLLLKADKPPKSSTTTTAAAAETLSPTGRDPTEPPLSPRKNGGAKSKRVSGHSSHGSSSGGSGDSIMDVSLNNSTNGHALKTALGQRLHDVADGVKPDYEDASLDKSKETVLKAPRALTSKALWTLEDFANWCENALDDLAIDAMMHRIFGAGLLASPSTERELTQQKWEEWKLQIDSNLSANEPEGTLEVLTESVKALLEPCFNGTTASLQFNGNGNGKILSHVWGGIGGIDGGGGVGHGVLYCVDKKWWDAWASYAGWSWVGDHPLKRRRSRPRPGSLSNEALLERDEESVVIPGTMGSYELMKRGLKRNKDYVLIPPGVWDILFEMYGGGPPLPRMVKPPQRKFSDANRSTLDVSESYPAAPDDIDEVMGSFEEDGGHRIFKLSDSLSVATHPWIIHCHLCDPQQPYRRGDAGPMSIRVMVTPDQPLWRMYAEVIGRFPLQSYKAFGSDGRGQGRLWKKTEPSAGKDPVSRYGPWNLLCKNRQGLLPAMTNGMDAKELKEFTDNWRAFTDNATVESIGLLDGDQIMLEFAFLNKNGELIWSREAAAKAGRVRRLAEEDMQFRQVLQGVDENGSLRPMPQNLVGMEVDAMDSTGRWYPVAILHVEVVDEDSDEEQEEEDEDDSPADQATKSFAKKKVKVDFKERGGHIEWIDVESDRLAKAGRFTADSERQSPTSDNGSARPIANDTKAKPAPPVKKTSNGENSGDTGKLCLLPGYGACGLTNLGNTCYANSAIQCISYVPLLRAYLLSSQYKANGDLNKDNPLGTGGRMLEELADLLRTMWSGRLGEKSPTRFRSQLAKVNAQFSGADQQDAQEFLNYMLDVLHEDSNNVRIKPHVEALEDDWVKTNSLPRVGDEAWRRFLRRNQSIMADVAMGQVLNTVTCPVCKYSSRNFDPFNLLSIPIPTVADVIFQCYVVRRATALNCPKTLNKPRKGDTAPSRFTRKIMTSGSSPPSENFVVEQYIIAMSRLADSGDLRTQIHNICGIPAGKLRLCRAEVIVLDKDADESSVVKTQTKVIPLTDKEGPCSQLAKKRAPNDMSIGAPTQILAFETTLYPRTMPSDVSVDAGEETADEEEEEDEEDQDEDRVLPTAKEQAEIESYLEVYGDEKECRIVDTDPFVITKAVSRSLWPRTETELKLGLRVDAKDHRGNWFPGSVVEIIDSATNGGDADTGDEVATQAKKVRVHFDNFSTKWDEMYSIDHFQEGRVRPVYSHASPRAKPTELLVHHRFTGRESGESFVFGQSFYVECQNDWSNARAGAHILAQASRFLKQSPGWGGPADQDESSASSAGKAHKLYDKTHAAISDLIDLLVDCDREYVRLALGVSEHNNADEKTQPFRNPSFDPTTLSAALVKKVSALLHRLPFEVRVCSIDASNADASAANVEELLFAFSLVRSIGNYINARHVIILHWREPPVDKKSGSPKNILGAPVMYVTPKVAIHEASAEILKNTAEAMNHHGKKSRAGSAGLDLGVCLTEFCKVQKLSLSDNWRCPRCKDFREARQSMKLWRLPDLMTFHIKRFNMSARWREKITTKVNFPLTGLDMSEWCHNESPATQIDPADSHIYDLIGVVNHYGSMTGGHYVATCKATGCGRDGKEEVSHSFNGVGASSVETEDADVPSGWRLGRGKVEINQSKVAATLSSKAAAESAEPLWLQFDDELVEPIPPRQVVSEMAYVLFYRRRRMTPANIAKYSTLE